MIINRLIKRGFASSINRAGLRLDLWLIKFCLHLNHDYL